MRDLVSIIVPVYNAEKVLDGCISSLLNQTYSNIQIILVNDGSSDDSLNICQQYAAEDGRIKCINQENRGVSVARNRGIDEAEGTWICFVDADDYVDGRFIESFVTNREQQQAQFTICGFKEVADDSVINETKGTIKRMNSSEAIEALLREDSFRGYVWNKMFCKKILDDNQIRFDADLALWEDVLFDVQYLLCADKIIYDPAPLYYYVYHTNSVSHENNHVIAMDKAFDAILAKDRIAEMLRKVPVQECVWSRLKLRYVQSALAYIRNVGYANADFHSKEFKRSIDILKENRKDVLVSLTKKERVLSLLGVYCPQLLLRLYRMRA